MSLYCLCVALFCCSGSYIRYDLNMPKSMPKRRDGPQNFNSDSPLTVQGHFQARLLGELFLHHFSKVHKFCFWDFFTLLCFKIFSFWQWPVSEMTYTVSSGTLNPSIPYHSDNGSSFCNFITYYAAFPLRGYIMHCTLWLLVCPSVCPIQTSSMKGY